MKFAMSIIQIVIISKEDVLSSEGDRGCLSRWEGSFNRAIGEQLCNLHQETLGKEQGPLAPMPSTRYQV